jgi:hypothetical protein
MFEVEERSEEQRGEETEGPIESDDVFKKLHGKGV